LLLNIFALLFAVSAVLAARPAYDESLTTTPLTVILASVALYFAIAYLPRSWLVVRIVSGLLVLPPTLVALYFITQFGYQNYPETPALIRQLGALTTLPAQLASYTFHPNTVATMLVITLPLVAARAITSRIPAGRIIWAITALIMLYALVLSVSYRGWFALAVTVALAVALYALRHWPRALAVGGIAILLVILLGVVALAMGTDLLPDLKALLVRLFGLGDLFSNSLYLARDYGFTGTGLGDTFAMNYSRYSLLIFVPFISYPNNLLLAVWLFQGILGLTAFIGIVVSLYALVYRVMSHTSPRRLFHGAWLGVTATLVHGLVDARHYADIAWIMPVLFAAIALTVAAGRTAMHEIEAYEAPQPLYWRRWVAVAAVIIVPVAIVVVFNRPIMAAWYTNLGAIDEARAELAPGPGSIADQIGQQTTTRVVLNVAQREPYYASAEAWYRQALDTDASYPNANRRLGNLLVKRDRFDEAVSLLEAAFAAEPDNPAAIKGLGLAYVWVGRTDDAARVFALHSDPGDIAGELNGWGSYRNGQNQPLLAARAWETAQLMDSESVNIGVWLLIADTYRSAGDTDGARRWYERVLDIEPDNRPAQDGLEQLG
jgi:tetratricopeptide (TPR) repeat protein